MRVPIHLRLAGSYVVVAAVSLVIGGALVERRVADEIHGEIAQRVGQEARLLAEEPTAHPVGEDKADEWADRRGGAIGARVTLIADDGRVLGDSDLSPQQVRTIENHGGRPEVVEARARGIGESSRYST